MQKRTSYLISKAFKNYLGASVLTVAATQVANIADASIVGNLIGPEGLAAVNLSKPVIQAIYSITCLYMSSSTILAGMAIGKGDKEKANKLFSFSLLVSLALGAIIVVGGLGAFDALSDMLCKSDNLRQLSNDFLFVTLLSTIPMMLMFTFHQFVTTDGSPKLISQAVIVGNIVNIGLDIILIKYANMGIKGAAWATFFMYVVCVLMVLPHFRKKGTLRFKIPTLKDLELSKILSFGLPLFFSTALLSIQYMGNNYAASTFLGDGGLIALAICMQLFSFSMIILTGTLRTIQPVGAILKGLEDHKGMKLLIHRAYAFMGICLVVYMLVIVCLPEQISVLLGAANEQTMPIIRMALPAFSLHIIMQALLYNLMPVYQFYDHKNLALFLSVGQTLLPMLCFWGMKGHWMGFFVGQIITAVVILISTFLIKSKDKKLSAIFLIPETESDAVYDSTIPTNHQALGETRIGLRDFLLALDIPQSKVNHAILCTEELLKNIIDHGHAKYVDVRATKDIISLHDDGKPFNPIGYVDENGLGLKIVNTLLSENMHYDYRFNQNMVTIELK